MRQQSFITIERENLDKEKKELTDSRSLSQMYIPDMKQLLSKKNGNILRGEGTLMQGEQDPTSTT